VHSSTDVRACATKENIHARTHPRTHTHTSERNGLSRSTGPASDGSSISAVTTTFSSPAGAAAAVAASFLLFDFFGMVYGCAVNALHTHTHVRTYTRGWVTPFLPPVSTTDRFDCQITLKPRSRITRGCKHSHGCTDTDSAIDTTRTADAHVAQIADLQIQIHPSRQNALPSQISLINQSQGLDSLVYTHKVLRKVSVLAATWSALLSQSSISNLSFETLISLWALTNEHSASASAVLSSSMLRTRFSMSRWSSSRPLLFVCRVFVRRLVDDPDAAGLLTLRGVVEWLARCLSERTTNECRV
jgi:hypothetical protein